MIEDCCDFNETEAQLHSGEWQDGYDVKNRTQIAPHLDRCLLKNAHSQIKELIFPLQLIVLGHLTISSQIDCVVQGAVLRNAV